MPSPPASATDYYASMSRSQPALQTIPDDVTEATVTSGDHNNAEMTSDAAPQPSSSDVPEIVVAQPEV